MTLKSVQKPESQASGFQKSIVTGRLRFILSGHHFGQNYLAVTTVPAVAELPISRSAAGREMVWRLIGFVVGEVDKFC